MSASYYRQEQTRTVVRHIVETPVNWVDMQKVLRAVISDMGYGQRAEGMAGEPSDDALWYEAEDDSIVLCYELTTGTSGGPSNSATL